LIAGAALATAALELDDPALNPGKKEENRKGSEISLLQLV